MIAYKGLVRTSFHFNKFEQNRFSQMTILIIVAGVLFMFLSKRAFLSIVNPFLKEPSLPSCSEPSLASVNEPSFAFCCEPSLASVNEPRLASLNEPPLVTG